MRATITMTTTARVSITIIIITTTMEATEDRHTTTEVGIMGITMATTTVSL